jgi:hypothetical protein
MHERRPNEVSVGRGNDDAQKPLEETERQEDAGRQSADPHEDDRCPQTIRPSAIFFHGHVASVSEQR